MTTTPPRHPGIGVATFLIDSTRGYILLGKRQGSHGSGTLALPGGHLEWNETWPQCAAREVAEETGVKLSREAEYVTAVNTTGIDAESKGDGGLHYVTIFMKSHLTRSRVDSIRNLEPHKCAGWAWVPINYLFSLYHGQESMERLASSSKQSGVASSELGVSLDKLLMAERLGERISQAASREGMGVGENDGGSQARHFIMDSSAPLQQQRRGSLEPKDDEEQVAWALADDLFRGAALFKPMMTVLRERGDLLRQELQPLPHQQEAFASTSSNPTSPPPPARQDVRLPPNLFPSDATTLINEALSAPPHFKHSLTFSFPTPTPTLARHIVAVLSVDKPLRPKDTRIKYEAVVEGVATPLVRVVVETSTVRLLRLTGNAVCEDVGLVVRTMQAFPGGKKAAAKGASVAPPTMMPTGEAFEEGTVGTVERTMAAAV